MRNKLVVRQGLYKTECLTINFFARGHLACPCLFRRVYSRFVLAKDSRIIVGS